MSAAGRVVAVVPAAGRGERMGSDLPKQYLSVDGEPLLRRTLAALARCEAIDSIVVAIHPDDEALYAAATAGLPKLRTPVGGGTERVNSVESAVRQLDEEDRIVLVHDAVRPWVTEAVVERVVAATREHGAAIAAMPATETVKQVDGDLITGTPDRRALWNAQTPQGFRRDVLLDAFARRDKTRPATDEAALVEAAGHPVRVVEGEYANVKVTTPNDLPAATGTGPRVGMGYDVHAFADGRPLILGGVTIPADRGLVGHSDADVLTHAVIDALLGAVALGDVGQLFPDTDAAFEGISSLVLLADVVGRVAALGARVVNVDTVIMAQAPRLAPHTRAIAESLAQTLGVAAGRVSVKATTTERLGFVGRQEGMAAQAVVLVESP